MAGIVASTNRTRTGYVREVTPGVTPNNPAFREIIKTSFGMKTQPSRGRSKDVRSDGQSGGTFLTDAANAGGIGYEHKFGHFDDFLESAIKSRFNLKAVKDNAGVADSVITAVTASGKTYSVITGGQAFAIGGLVLASGFIAPGNNGLFRAGTGTNATTVAAPAQTLIDEAIPPGAAKLKCVGFEGASGDITATASGLASTALDFTTFNLQPGEWHYLGGTAAGNKFATAANRGWGRLQSVSANALVYDILPAGWSVDAGASKAIQIFIGDFAKNGTTIDSYTFENQQQDIAVPIYEYFRGDFVNGLTISLTGAKEIDIATEWIGMSGSAPVTARLAGATDIAAPVYGTMTANLNVGDLTEGGVSLIGGANCMSAGSIKIANNIAREPVVGGLGNSAINVGSLMVSGDIDTYLGDASILSKGINDTFSGFSFPTAYASGNREGYRFDVPAIKIIPTSDVPGGNQGRKVAGPYEAEPHPVLGYTISIGRFFYLPA